MTERIAARFETRRSPLADAAPTDPWLDASQPAAILWIGMDAGAVPSAFPASVVPLHAGPGQWLLVSESDDAAALAANLPSLPPNTLVTDISHARLRLRLRGSMSLRVLQSGVAIDLRPAAFPVGYNTPCAFRDIAITLHAAATDVWDLYAFRSYAQSLWHWLVDIRSAVRTP